MPDPRISKVEADAKIREALEKETLLVVQERKEKRRSIDILPLIEKMRVKASVHSEEGFDRISGGEEKEERGNNGWGIELVLRRSNGGTAKPSEVIGAILGLEGESLTQIKVVKLE